MTREIIKGVHTQEAIEQMSKKIDILEIEKNIYPKAQQIISKSIDPKSKDERCMINGLLYGLIQSGKTSIITLVTALAADNGFDLILILTSDIDLLYEQTIDRIKKGMLGVSVLGREDWKDPIRFKEFIKNTPLVVVCSKNASRLNGLIESFKKLGYSKKLSVYIIDDEADQASLNTLANKKSSQISAINFAITELRNFFPINTYLQVTATPQALFLQTPNHFYRPSFTVLSKPGIGYIGGESFFDVNSKLLVNVDIDEVNALQSKNQPYPTSDLPHGLRRAIIYFIVSATINKMVKNPEEGYAFLCHVSMRKLNHEFIVNLIDKFKRKTLEIFNDADSDSTQRKKIISEFQETYENIQSKIQGTSNLPSFDELIKKIQFYLRGANVKLINAQTSEEITLESVYNLFVGGNKLGRGVTIPKLLVTYYGRNPKNPNSDTVLQHARMYGYRNNELEYLRLFLPERLAENFRIIHQMESGLRKLINEYPDGIFEGIYIENPLKATRKNVLDIDSIGMYTAGSVVNPIYPLRDNSVLEYTKKIDNILSKYSDTEPYSVTTIDEILGLIDMTQHDTEYRHVLWNTQTIIVALQKLKGLKGNDAYIRVRKDRELEVNRRETQGFLSGGESQDVPSDKITLFMYRIKESTKGFSVWWPMLRFPTGNYMIMFSFEA